MKSCNTYLRTNNRRETPRLSTLHIPSTPPRKKLCAGVAEVCVGRMGRNILFGFAQIEMSIVIKQSGAPTLILCIWVPAKRENVDQLVRKRGKERERERERATKTANQRTPLGKPQANTSKPHTRWKSVGVSKILYEIVQHIP